MHKHLDIRNQKHNYAIRVRVSEYMQLHSRVLRVITTLLHRSRKVAPNAEIRRTHPIIYERKKGDALTIREENWECVERVLGSGWAIPFNSKTAGGALLSMGWYGGESRTRIGPEVFRDFLQPLSSHCCWEYLKVSLPGGHPTIIPSPDQQTDLGFEAHISNGHNRDDWRDASWPMMSSWLSSHSNSFGFGERVKSSPEGIPGGSQIPTSSTAYSLLSPIRKIV
jgi:hypothetical protein